MKDATSINEMDARGFYYCPSCAKEKEVGMIVCWDCFKGRTPNTPALKTYEGTFEQWMHMLFREEVAI